MAARTPDYQPVMIEGLQDQIIGILQRDFAANLALVNPAVTYAGINEYHRLLLDSNFENAPECVVEAVSTTLEQNDQDTLTCQHTLSVGVVITAMADTEELAQQSRDYARALIYSLCRQQDYSDYWTPLPVTIGGIARSTAGMPAGAVKEVSLKSVNWAMKGSLQQQIGRMPTIELLIATEER